MTWNLTNGVNVNDNVNGVKQGGVLSPILYLLYTDGLLVKLSNFGVGCYIGSFFCWSARLCWWSCVACSYSFCHASTASYCDEYADEFSIKFNAKKSKWLAIVSKKRHWLSTELDFSQFHVGGSAIDRVSSFVHLGHIINTELSDNDDISHRRCTFVGQVNNVLCSFPMLGTNVRL